MKVRIRQRFYDIITTSGVRHDSKNAKKTFQKVLTSKLGMCIMMTIKLGKSHGLIHKEGLQ